MNECDTHLKIIQYRRGMISMKIIFWRMYELDVSKKLIS